MEEAEQETPEEGISTGAIVGITIGCIAAFIIVIILVKIDAGKIKKDDDAKNNKKDMYDSDK